MFRTVLLLLLALPFHSNAQIFYRRSEFGLGGGGSNYYGDLNPGLGYDGIKYSGSFFYKYNFTPYIAFKASSAYAKLNGDDKYSTNVFQRERNLNFYSDVFETHIAFDFHFFKYNVQDFDHRITPYVTFGVGMFWFNPYTFYDGRRYNLKPLGTEGQLYEQYADRRYRSSAFDFPIGAGIKFWLSGGMTLNVEVINRSTTTDYLDDVSNTYVGIDKFLDVTPSPYPSVSSVLQDRSLEVGSDRLGIPGKQRGVSTTKDQWMTMQIGLSFRLPTYKCPSNF